MTLQMHNVCHYLVSLIAEIEIIPSLNLKIILLASHLPHIPEYLSISSGVAAEDISDNSKIGEMLDPMCS